MPLSRDPAGGGTEADGTLSTEYCSHCYQNGHFVDGDITVDEMVERVRGKLQEMNLPEPAVESLALGVRKLRRWV
jgi:hypothetical protein